ncbi:MAG: hypothetical protein H6Q76_2294 [Firmicutes bacterium]|nr:hypothetical protein [Bacillota bacterium]
MMPKYCMITTARITAKIVYSIAFFPLLVKYSLWGTGADFQFAHHESAYVLLIWSNE